MAVKVRIPTPLQKLTNGKAEVECGARNIHELIDALEQVYPGMKERLTDGGKVRRFINIYVNDEDIRFMNKEETTLKDGDNISIVPAIAGGQGNAMTRTDEVEKVRIRAFVGPRLPLSFEEGLWQRRGSN